MSRNLLLSIIAAIILLTGTLLITSASATTVTSPVLTLSGTPLSTGSNTYTAVLTTPSGAPAPTGPVVITDSAGGTCTATLNGTGTNYSGSCTISDETPGETVTATYGGDQPAYASLTSGPLTVGTSDLVPGSPSGITVTPGIGSATVSWTPPSTAGGGVIVGYTVTALGANGSLGPSCTTTTTSCTIDGLNSGEPYTFQVVANNSAGSSPPASTSSSASPYVLVGSARLAVVGKRTLHSNGVLVRLSCSGRPCHATVRLYGHGKVLVQRLSVNIRVGRTSRTLLRYTPSGRSNSKSHRGRVLLLRGGAMRIEMRK